MLYRMEEIILLEHIQRQVLLINDSAANNFFKAPDFKNLLIYISHHDLAKSIERVNLLL